MDVAARSVASSGPGSSGRRPLARVRPRFGCSSRAVAGGGRGQLRPSTLPQGGGRRRVPRRSARRARRPPRAKPPTDRRFAALFGRGREALDEVVHSIGCIENVLGVSGLARSDGPARGATDLHERSLDIVGDDVGELRQRLVLLEQLSFASDPLGDVPEDDHSAGVFVTTIDAR
ncbi:hypothetical protein D8S78_09710 [Natrialba swarupiae]|nr:hypothetical protein [Natrialba swarupiae]